MVRPEMRDEAGEIVSPKLIQPNTQDPLSALSFIENLQYLSGDGSAKAAKADKKAAAIDGPREGAIFVMCDLAPRVSLQGPEEMVMTRHLRELAHTFRGMAINIILLGAVWPEIPELEKDLLRLDLPLPQDGEIDAMVQAQVAPLAAQGSVTVDTSEETRNGVVDAFLGLTEGEITSVLRTVLIRKRALTAESIPTIVDEKRAVIGKTGCLTYTHPERIENLGGYLWVHQLLDEAADSMSPKARAYGVRPRKGYLFVGPPGCGKDLIKRCTASRLNRPLLDMDMGSVMGDAGGIVGSGAVTIKKALGIAATVRGVLGISEFEKATGGLASSAKTDGGETARTIAYLLNWLQDQTDVFVVATANDVRQLPGELLREGRIEIKFIDKPDAMDRMKIFEVHLRKRGRLPEEFDLVRLADEADLFVGAEIEAVVDRGLLRAYRDGARPLTTDDLLAQIPKIVPVFAMKRDDLAEQQAWVKDVLGIDLARTAEDATVAHMLNGIEL